jgi:hypothetical protein
MFRLLRRGPFALLWAGATVSTTGDAMSWVALVWLVYRQRASPATWPPLPRPTPPR